MRYLDFIRGLCLLISFSDFCFCADHFVITAKLPSVKFTKIVTPKSGESIGCLCGGDREKCICEPDACRCMLCKHNADKSVKEPEQTVEAKALSEDGVYLDDEYLSKARLVSSSAPKQKTVFGFGPVWCNNCKPYKAKIGNGDEELVVVWSDKEVRNPKTKQPPKSYPCLWNPYTEEFYYNDEIKSLDQLKARMGVIDPIAGGIPAGKIQRKLLELPLELISFSSGLAWKNNKPYEKKIGPAKIVAKTNFEANWTREGNMITITFKDPPSFVWGWVDKNLNAIKISENQIEFDIHRLPNVVLDIVDEVGSPESISLPNIPIAQIDFQMTLPLEIDSRTALSFLQAEGPIAGRLDELSRSTHGPLYTYPGDVTGHLIGTHGITADELRPYNNRQRENIHSSLHNGMRPANLAGSVTQPVKTRQYAFASVPRRMRGGCPGGNCPN